MDVQLLRHRLDAPAAAQIGLQRRDVLAVVLPVIFDQGRQRLVRQIPQERPVLYEVEHAVHPHPVKILKVRLSFGSHLHGGARPLVGKVQILYVFHLVADADVDLPVCHLDADPVRKRLQNLFALFLPDRVHDDDKIGRIVKEMPVVREVCQVQMHSVGDPLALDRIHTVQVSRRDQSDLKDAVQIEVGQEVPRVQILCLGLLDGVDQSPRDLFVRGGLHKDPNGQILDQIRQDDLPGDRQQRKVVGVAKVLHGLRDLLDIKSCVDDQSRGIVCGQLLHQSEHRLFFLKAESRSDRQLLAGKVLDDGQFLQHKQPADGIGPAAASGFHLHFVSVLGYDQHIFNSKTHFPPPAHNSPLYRFTLPFIIYSLCCEHNKFTNIEVSIP